MVFLVLKPGTAFAVALTEPTVPSLSSPSLLQGLVAVAEAALRPWQRSALEVALPCKGDSFHQPRSKGTLQAHASPQVATM